MMMDAVPGIPTHFWFRPTITTAEMKKITNNPDFEYVLVCNKLCGAGHYNMQKKMRIVTEAQYEAWLSTQNSYYETVVKPGMAGAEKPAATAMVATDSLTKKATPKMN
jgi:cytochrome c oxidase subunit 2